MNFIALVFFGLFALLSGCASAPSVQKTEDLSDLKTLHNQNSQFKKEELTSIRYNALRDTALSLGARAGLAWRAKQINELLGHYGESFDHIYHFEQLLLENRVLPPVLTEGRQTLEQADSQTIRIADRAYIIDQQARFVTMAPTWRDYLWLSFEAPTLPDQTLLPRNKAEMAIWSQYVEEGWIAGIHQADAIVSQNLNRLTRDFTGMLRYRSLLAQNMVSAPFVAKMELGITGGADEMAINDRVLRITALPAFQSDGQQWKTTLTADDSL